MSARARSKSEESAVMMKSPSPRVMDIGSTPPLSVEYHGGHGVRPGRVLVPGPPGRRPGVLRWKVPFGRDQWPVPFGLDRPAKIVVQIVGGDQPVDGEIERIGQGEIERVYPATDAPPVESVPDASLEEPLGDAEGSSLGGSPWNSVRYRIILPSCLKSTGSSSSSSRARKASMAVDLRSARNSSRNSSSFWSRPPPEPPRWTAWICCRVFRPMAVRASYWTPSRARNSLGLTLLKSLTTTSSDMCLSYLPRRARAPGPTRRLQPALRRAGRGPPDTP